MFQLKVVGLDEATQLIREGWPTRIISLTSDERLDYGPHHLHIQVADVPIPISHAPYPCEELLCCALDFTRDLTDEDRLLVHCFAGQSRSAAIGIAILIQHGMHCDEAFDKVLEIRDIMLPNMLFIKHTDAHFDLKGKLVARAKAHQIAVADRMRALPSPPPSEDGDLIKKLLRLFGAK